MMTQTAPKFDKDGRCIRDHLNRYSALYGMRMCIVCGAPEDEQKRSRRQKEDAIPSEGTRKRADAARALRIKVCGEREGGHNYYLDTGTGVRCMDCGGMQRDIEGEKCHTCGHLPADHSDGMSCDVCTAKGLDTECARR